MHRDTNTVSLLCPKGEEINRSSWNHCLIWFMYERPSVCKPVDTFCNKSGGGKYKPIDTKFYTDFLLDLDTNHIVNVTYRWRIWYTSHIKLPHNSRFKNSRWRIFLTIIMKFIKWAWFKSQTMKSKFCLNRFRYRHSPYIHESTDWDFNFRAVVRTLCLLFE